MLKKINHKKAIVTISLLGTLLCINTIPAFAGTNRSFWDMSIRSCNSSSSLVNRNKETSKQYSRVKSTGMTSVKSVKFKFVQGASTDATSWYKISQDHVWYTLPYNFNVNKGNSIHLSAMNGVWSTSSGKVSGVVDYE